MPSHPFPPPAPQFGEPLPSARPSQEVLDFLALRRSAPVALLGEPGPSPAEVDALLHVAARVPDHGKLAPWRFLVFEGEARAKAGVILERQARRSQTHLPEEGFALEAQRFLRAPVVVAVISRLIDTPKIPEWEQRLSSAAACMQLLNAACAMGYSAQWVTDWCAYDVEVFKAFGLGAGEKIAGYVYVGTAREPSPERVRPDVAALTSRWTGA
jgi:nitroreductase